MLPFSVEQFHAVFVQYNAVLWPVVAIAYAAGAFALYAAARARAPLARGASLVLAAMWAWTGIAYHIIHFAAINPLAKAFGALFVAEALLLLYFGVVRGQLQFRSAGLRHTIGWLFVAYVVVAYPMIGLATGTGWIGLPHFGVTPCPLTLFTFGLLLLARPPVPWALMAIPVIWSLIGGSAAFLLGVPQDWPLLAGGIITSAVLFMTRRTAANA